MWGWLRNRAWRKRGRDNPELAAIVTRIFLVLDQMQEAASQSFPRRDAPRANELLRLGGAVARWTNQFAGVEARAWRRQLNIEVAGRLGKIIAKTAELDDAVRLDRLRRQWEDLVLPSSRPDNAPGQPSMLVRRR
jgi:hypothetical protein